MVRISAMAVHANLFIPLTMVMLFLSLAGVALAQAPASGFSERQARAAVVPYVRAATDCIATQMMQDARFAAFAREGRVMALIPDAAHLCQAKLKTMSQALDHYYWPGKGAEFVSGPYIEDLPRALNERMKARIERLAQEDQQEAQRKRERSAVATQERDRAADAFWTCAADSIASLIRSGERAELIADACLGVCASQLNRLIDAATEVAIADGLSPREARGYEMRQELRKIFRDKAVSLAVVAKAGAGGADGAKGSLAPTRSDTRQSVAFTPEERKLADCVTTMADKVKPKLAETDKKLEVVLDMCRPEIEATARAHFAATGNTEPLDELRQRAFMETKDAAERALNR